MLAARLKRLWKSPQTSAAPRPALRSLDLASVTCPELERLIADRPSFHLYNGALINAWSIHADTLRFLYSLLRPGMATLETGCGQSTVVFAIAGTAHTCIMPEAGEAERVQHYCAELGCRSAPGFLIDSSDRVLPCSDRVPPALDHVFIDGAHAFPAPIVDWHYTADRLRIGGTLGIDDYRMPSVKLLHDFLCADDRWELLAIVQNTSFFRKRGDRKPLVDWTAQKINADYPGY
jgi:Methyltransferase domain